MSMYLKYEWHDFDFELLRTLKRCSMLLRYYKPCNPFHGQFNPIFWPRLFCFTSSKISIHHCHWPSFAKAFMVESKTPTLIELSLSRPFGTFLKCCNASCHGANFGATAMGTKALWQEFVLKKNLCWNQFVACLGSFKYFFMFRINHINSTLGKASFGQSDWIPWLQAISLGLAAVSLECHWKTLCGPALWNFVPWKLPPTKTYII